MGRRGGGGGGGRSGGSRSSGRSGGSHRSGGGRSSFSRSSSRSSFGYSSGRSSFGSSSGRSSFGRSSYHNPIRTNVHLHMGMDRASYSPIGFGGSSGYKRDIVKRAERAASLVKPFLFTVLLAIVLMIGVSLFNVYRSLPKNTTNREPIVSGYSFSSDCIEDEIDWIASEKTMLVGMKKFYEKTGVQPYVILCPFDANIATDEEREQNTYEIYDRKFGDREDIFLYVYYDDYNVDGLSTYVVGNNARSVMDDEAMDIFWQYFDNYWYGSQFASGEEDEMFSAIFEKVADSIMTKSKTGADVVITAIIALVAICCSITIVVIVKSKHARERQKAEETERILRADIDSLISSAEEDLLNKYK